MGFYSFFSDAVCFHFDFMDLHHVLPHSDVLVVGENATASVSAAGSTIT